MNRTHFVVLTLVLSLSCIGFSQEKISIDNLYDGTFRGEYLDQIHSMKDGNHYTVLNFDRKTRSSSLDQYSYKNLKKTKTIVSSLDLTDIRWFSAYTFTKDETKVLLETQRVPIYRRSKKAVYYVYDTLTKETTLVSEHSIQEPTFSADGTKVAFARNRNLFVKDLDSGELTQITNDGDEQTINGITDWVYEEEFSFVRAFHWNSSGSHLAYLRFDESDVPVFSMDMYGKELYQTQHVFRYPKAGEKNSVVSLHVYDFDQKKSKTINLEDAYYIPRFEFTNDSKLLSVQTLNRHQNDLRLLYVNVQDGSVEPVLQETDAAYVDVHDNLTFLSDHSFIWSSESDGYNHLYHYTKEGKLINQVTKGPWEITEYYGYYTDSQRIYYQSVERGSIYRDIFSIKIDGSDKKQLSQAAGTHDASFNENFSVYINTYSNAVTPPVYTLNSAIDGSEFLTIKENNVLSKVADKYDWQPKEFSTLSVNGQSLNMWMLRPSDFDPSKKYPVLMFQYSGPGSQKVADKWFDSYNVWHQMLTQQGYIIVCVDGRGTGFKGAEFKKSTYLNLVKLETEDQIDAAKQLGELSFVDSKRIGIWGWSFGGHMATNCLLKGNDVFSMAIAVAPVTSWRFYDTIYTERFMRTPQENALGYDGNSPLNYPELLKGKYLLVHGSGDDNVHVQNTMRMVEALIQADKDFEWMIYPDRNHGIYGGNTRLHLFKKMTKFINDNL